MSVAETILSVTTWLALALLIASFLLTVWRVVQGPTLPDRVVALDMLVGIVIGFIALIAIRTGFTLYIDIAIALGLVGFLATVAFARFILVSKAKQKAIKDLDPQPPQAASSLPPGVEPEKVRTAAEKSRRKAMARADGDAGRSSAKPPAKAATDGEPAQALPLAAAPATKPAGKSRGKSNKGSDDSPQNKSANKTANKSESKSPSKSAGKSSGKTAAGSAAKAPGKPRTRSKEQ